MYAEVEGLTGEERRQVLIELATDECDEPIDLYTSINVEMSQPLLDQFTEDTGVPAQLYRAANEDVNRRVLQEEEADVANVADVIANNDLEQAILAREGILAPLDTPATEGNSVVHDTWAGADRLVYMAAWSDSLEDPPTTWEEVFNAEGLAYQLGDVNWFATLVNDYYVAEQGMTEREAVDMIRDAVSGTSQIVDGHTLGAQLLTAGEYPVGSSLYLYRVRLMIEEGAPIAWEPAVEPLIARVTGVGMHHRTPCPASAMLLTEYILIEFQEMLPEFGRLPAVEGGEGGIPEQYQVLPINLDVYLDDYDKWQAYHDEVTGAIGGEILSE
ncbi:MAG: hypothetical protein GEU81_12730 [Nitriliruptorales bacterium]|nr:hypothetical protein [Nitriliruptorales bacterium]